MKRLFLIAACAAALAACSDRTYTYEAKETVVGNQLIGMGTISTDSSAPQGGTLTIGPAVYDPAKGKEILWISGSDYDADGAWDTMAVCGYLHRRDGKPTCGGLTRNRLGWDFDPSTEDRGAIDPPSRRQIQNWIAMLNRGRTQLEDATSA